MSLIAEINNSNIGQILAFVGLGSLVDALIGNKNRAAISGYISNARDTSLKEFEFSVITALIGLVTDRRDIERISPLRVVIYAFFCNAAAEVISFVSTGFLITLDSTVQAFSWSDTAWLALMGAAVSYPFDYYSLSVTKKIFFYEVYAVRELPWLWIYDLCLSLTPIVIAAMVLFAVIGLMGYMMTMMLVSLIIPGFAGSIVGSILLSVVQMIIVASGILLRALASLIDSWGPAARKIGVSQIPVTICFLAFALVVVAIELVS